MNFFAEMHWSSKLSACISVLVAVVCIAKVQGSSSLDDIAFIAVFGSVLAGANGVLAALFLNSYLKSSSEKFKLAEDLQKLLDEKEENGE